VTVDGYSYLQENERAKPVSAPVAPRRPAAPRRAHGGGGSDRVSPMPLIFGIVILVIGFTVMKLILNVQRLASPHSQSTAQVSPSATPRPTSPTSAGTSPAAVAAASVAPAASASATSTPNPIAAAALMPNQPEVRKARPVTKEEIAKAEQPANSPAESGEQARVAIRPLKRTYVRVTVGDTKGTPAFERWVSPSDGPVEFRGKHVSIRVLDREAVKITKNGQDLQQNDQDVTVN